MKNRHSWILKKAAALLIALTLLMSALPAALAVAPDWSELQITVSWINAATGETAYANATPVYDAEGNFWIMLPPEAPLDGLTIFVTHPNEAYQIWPAAGEALGYVTVVGDTMDGINYLPGEDLGEVFRRLCLFVRPGGLLIFDVKSPESLRALDGSVSVDEDDDMLCLWRADFDEAENCLVYGMDLFEREGALWRRSGEEHIEYAHTPETLRSALSSHGFESVRFVSDGPQGDAGRVFVCAKRKA